MATLPNVRLDLSNRPENVLLVREALTGLAEGIGLDGSDLSDVRTAVTEACNNVVIHAYEGGEGPLEVEVEIPPEELRVIVRDHGIGMDPARRVFDPDAGLETGIGLPVIEALAAEAEFARTEGGGVEVRMTFAAPGVDGVAAPDADAPAQQAARPAGTTRISIAPATLARAIAPRLLCVLAARAQFSTDRISDSQLLADAIVAHASGALSGSRLELAVNVEPRDLELSVGPLLAGRAQRLVHASDVEGLGPVLEKLADGHDVSSGESHDTLMLSLRDRAAAR